MKNWKTTLGGIMAAIGQYLTQAESGWLNIAGQVISGIGLLLLGAAAQDSSVSK
jgi:hypothetical protein